jgi:hypothetical protein
VSVEAWTQDPWKWCSPCEIVTPYFDSHSNWRVSVRIYSITYSFKVATRPCHPACPEPLPGPFPLGVCYALLLVLLREKL